MPNYDVYESPLVARYASPEMSELFGERTRIRTWRRLWLALAKAEHRAGIRVTAPDQVRPALEKALAINGPVLIDFQVDPEENVFPIVPPGERMDKMIDLA